MVVRVSRWVALTCLMTSSCFMWAGAARTPMPETEVKSLTTCKTGDLAAIKKNLMLAGYSIRSADDETIETDFKQTAAGYGRGKEFLKITAVKVDDETTKFRVRVRTESLDQVTTGEVKDSAGRTVATDSTLVENKNESDEGYFVERKDEYNSTHKDVCGS